MIEEDGSYVQTRFLLLIALTLGVSFTSSCAIENVQIDEDLRNILATTLDLNGDGVVDVWYQYDADLLPGYYELVDRDFDGRVDESSFFSGEHTLLYSRSDDNGDTYMDTITAYKHGTASGRWVDSDRNGVIDIAFEYVFGKLRSATRYYPRQDRMDKPQVGITQFFYEYPKAETRYNVDFSEEEFEQRYNPIVPLTPSPSTE